MFESPHRLAATLADLLEVCGPARKLTVARELTKRFEEIATFALGEGAAWLAADPHREQGEFVLIVHADEAGETRARSTRAPTRARRLAGNPVRARAAKVAAKVTGLPKDALYSRALRKTAAATGRRDRGSYWHGLCNGRVRQARRPRRTAGLPGHAHAAGRDAPGRQRQGLRGAWFTDQALLLVRRLAARRIESDPGTGRRELEEWFAKDRRASRWRWIRSARRSSMKSGAPVRAGFRRADELRRTGADRGPAQGRAGHRRRGGPKSADHHHSLSPRDRQRHLARFWRRAAAQAGVLAHEGNLYVSRSPGRAASATGRPNCPGSARRRVA